MPLNPAPSGISMPENEAEHLMSLLERIQPNIQLSPEARALAGEVLHVLPGAPTSTAAAATNSSSSRSQECQEALLRQLESFLNAYNGNSRPRGPRREQGFSRQEARQLVRRVPTLEEQQEEEEVWIMTCYDTDDDMTGEPLALVTANDSSIGMVPGMALHTPTNLSDSTAVGELRGVVRALLDSPPGPLQGLSSSLT